MGAIKLNNMLEIVIVSSQQLCMEGWQYASFKEESNEDVKFIKLVNNEVNN